MEYRKHPLVDRWVIIAPGRLARPHDFVDTARVQRRGDCPFCAGHEADTPTETAAIRDPGTTAGGPGWRVRAVLNKFPFLKGDATSEPRTSVSGPHGDGAEAGPLTNVRGSDGVSHPLTDVRGSDVFVSLPAVGPHEVLIDSPRHVTRASELSVAETADVLRLYRLRLADLRRDGRFAYVQIFRNVGEAAGASIEHLHGQLAALDLVPAQVAAEVAALAERRARGGGCAYCEVIAAELAAGERIVEVTPRFVALCPYASGFSYEMEVWPRGHVGGFDRTDDSALDELAGLLRRTLLRLERTLPQASYNLLLCSEPFDSFAAAHYHWRMTILPRTAKTAGFEWGTGILVNPVPPEEAAAALRQALAESAEEA